MRDEIEKKIDELILTGSLEVHSVDSNTGELLYTFTDKLKDLDPVLYDEMSALFSLEILHLWQNGFVDMDITLDNPNVFLTDMAFDDEEVAKLDESMQSLLKQIKDFY